MGAFIADALTPNTNLISAKMRSELVTPAIRVELAKPITPIASIHFLFQTLLRSLINILEKAYGMLSNSSAMIP